VDAFRSHTLVALGEVHGREADQTVRLALIHDPRLPSVVDDIVVEFGSAEFQDVKDRFLAGDAVSEEVLQKVWLNAAPAFHQPMYERFFREVRSVNARDCCPISGFACSSAKTPVTGLETRTSLMSYGERCWPNIDAP
jgi:hypothetical protein